MSEPDPTMEVDGVTPLQPADGHSDARDDPERLGRYLLVERLGQGGMGVVHRAHDPTLDRDVALKRLRPSGNRGSWGTDQARLLREAQAMAKLSHPNVVPVFAAEVIDDEVVVAMELVEGQTLGQWLEEQQPGWKAIVATFVGAGRGLAAAHRAGLVHRDFKPSNVLVDAEGRARVMDFGLARPLGDGVSGQSTISGDSLRISSVTTAGAVAGTPRYMAPEQHMDGFVDARADQYAFSVSLWTAVFGASPFSAEHYDELVRAKLDEDVAAPPRSAAGIPRSLIRILRRGLSSRPMERYPDMDALLAELDATIRPKRVAWWAAGGGTLAGAGAVAAVLGAEPRQCEGAEQRLEPIWNDEVRGRLASVFETTGAVHAGHSHERVGALLDAFADDWARQHQDACLATHERGEQSAEGLDLRVACLDRQAVALQATLDVLLELDAEGIDHAIRTAAGLPDPRICADLERLRAAVPPPDDPKTAARVQEIRADLAHIEALGRAGRWKDAGSETTSALEASRQTGYRPLVAEAMVRHGEVLERLDDYEQAATLLEDAYYEARATDHGDEVLRAVMRLIYVEGYRRQDAEAAERWMREARAELDRGDAPPHAEVVLHSHAGTVETMAGNLEKAMEHFQTMVELEEAREPEAPLDLADAYNRLGTAYYSAERSEDAYEYLHKALGLYREELGPEHPKLIPALTNLGAVCMAMQRLDESLELLRAASELAITSHGSQSTDVAMIDNHIGNVLSLMGEHDEALERFERAAEVLQAKLGPEHQYTNAIINNWGAALDRKGDKAAAVEKYEEALALAEATLPPEHPALAEGRTNIGMALASQGRHEDALRYHERAAPTYEKAFGSDSIPYALSLGHIGRCMIELNRASEAVEVLERAVAIELPDHVPAHDATGPVFALARALWQSGGDRRRAVELAKRAQTALTEADRTNEAEIVARWLADHRL